jgi:hypothetical protein
MLLAILLAGSGAWAQKIEVQFDASVDFSKYKTFAIRNGTLNSRSPSLNSELIQKQIETDIRRDLTSRGLTEATGGAADLNVLYHFGSHPKSELEAFPAGWRGWGTQWARVPYAEGTLVIDLRDPVPHSLVWRGIASEEKSNPADIQKKLDDMVRKAIEKYPPKK